MTLKLHCRARFQYRAEIGNSSAGNSEITRQPLSVTTTSSSMRATSRRLRNVMQHKKLGGRAGYERESPPLLVAEFDEQSIATWRFHHGADLSPRKIVRWTSVQQRNNVEQSGLPVLVFLCHHSTQVTKHGLRRSFLYDGLPGQARQ
jgi:hypothetical protein